jgi:hypothetical protein
MSIQEFGFGDGDAKARVGKSKRFKMDEGQIARLSIAWYQLKDDGTFDLESTPRFKGVNSLYVNNVGYVQNEGPEYLKYADGPPKMRIGTVVVSWPLTKSGDLDKEAFKRGEFEVMTWVFAQARYTELADQHKDWPCGKHDLKIKGLDKTYQKMEIKPCPDSLLNVIMTNGDKTKQLRDILIAQVNEAVAALDGDLAQKMSIEKLREKVTGDAAPALAVPTTDVDAAIDALMA